MDEYGKFEGECEKRKMENHTFTIGFMLFFPTPQRTVVDLKVTCGF